MKRKGLKGKLWMISAIFILITLVIIILFLYIGTDVPYDTNDSLTTEKVLLNSEDYINKTITVEGYYYDFFDDKNDAYISPIKIQEPILQDEIEEKNFLLLNTSKINENISENIKYDFSGKLVEIYDQDYPFDRVMLILYNYE